jgi:hypothetical protein
MLVTPFEETDAYKQGIIDEKGKVLKKASTLKSSAEKDAYTYLHRLVFNMKRIINKLPGGETKLKSMIAAFFLIKECYLTSKPVISESRLEQRYKEILDIVERQDVTLVEEEIVVKKFMEEVAANFTGAGVSTNEPTIKPKKTVKRKELSVQ